MSSMFVKSKENLIKNLRLQLNDHYKDTGFVFNLMIVGHPGCGKDSFLNALFGCELTSIAKKDQSDYVSAEVKDLSSTLNSYDIIENGVKCRLNVTSFSNFGLELNVEHQPKELRNMITDCYYKALTEEFSVNPYSRLTQAIDLVVYFAQPLVRGLLKLDIETLSGLDCVNKVLVVSKTDSLVGKELKQCSEKIWKQLSSHGIKCIKFHDLVENGFNPMMVHVGALNTETGAMASRQTPSTNQQNDFALIEKNIFPQVIDFIKKSTQRYYSSIRTEQLKEILSKKYPDAKSVHKVLEKLEQDDSDIPSNVLDEKTKEFESKRNETSIEYAAKIERIETLKKKEIEDLEDKLEKSKADLETTLSKKKRVKSAFFG